jgi:hypothetical protein
MRFLKYTLSIFLFVILKSAGAQTSNSLSWLDLKNEIVVNEIINTIAFNYSDSITEKAREVRDLIKESNGAKTPEAFALIVAEIKDKKTQDPDLWASYCVIIDAAMKSNEKKNPNQFDFSAQSNCVSTLINLAEKGNGVALFWRGFYYQEKRGRARPEEITRDFYASAKAKHAVASFVAGSGLMLGLEGWSLDKNAGKTLLEFAREKFSGNKDVANQIDDIYVKANEIERNQKDKQAKKIREFEEAVLKYKSFEVFYVCVDKYPAGGRSQSVAKLVAQLAANNYLEQMTKLIYDSKPNINCEAMNGNFDRSKITRDTTDIVTGNSGNQLFIVKTSNQASVILTGRK